MSKPGDPRLIDLLSRKHVTADEKKRVAILGYPCDIGVVRNNGRPGAKRGPDAVRGRLPKLGPLINAEFNIDLRHLSLVDRGNIEVTESLENNHIALTRDAQRILDDGYLTIIIGGGNDQSYCNAKALMNSQASGRIGVVNIDAHLDVRPLIDGNLAHSGSPFRQLLSDSQFRNDGGKFCEFAIQGNQSSSEHAQYVRDNGGDVIWLSQVRRNVSVEFEKVLRSFSDRDVFVSFDIDSIQSSDCPGVSCPAVIGLSAQDALDVCFAAGRHPKTRMLDLSEYNPDIEEYRTASLVCNMIYYFLMGVATRS